MVRYAIKVFYFGLNFYGSQIQKDKRTVEGEIINTLKNIGYEVRNFKRASRTDKHVSALQNVFAFDTNKEIDIRVINKNLPDDIRILAATIVDEDFNPRYGVEEKEYKYFLFDEGFNLEKIKEAARIFVGKHDFYNFCIRKGLKKNTIKYLKSLDVDKIEDIILLTFRAKSFLRGMIRKIVTALSLVGKGEISIDDIREALERKKELRLTPAPGEFLVLWDIKYKNVNFEFDEEILREVKEHIIKKFYSKYKTYKVMFEKIINMIY